MGVIKTADRIYEQACIKLYRGVKFCKGIVELVRFELKK